MTPADFEESEYRGPLYNQLERGSHLVWEPGQVFEKHIGIDRAAYVHDSAFWSLHGRSSPFAGAVLIDLDLAFIWEKKKKHKQLPDFQLNLFIQAKRPFAGVKPRGKVRTAGIKGDYWKFNVTTHQQRALEQMHKALAGQALVIYASPAFHTQAALYQHTKDQRIVTTSTFPSVDMLATHGAWYYEQGGLEGVANPDFRRMQMDPLDRRIEALVQANYSQQGPDVFGSLRELDQRLTRSVSERDAPAPIDTWALLQLERVDRLFDELDDASRPREWIEATRSYARVMAICNAYKLDWFVLGKGG